MSFISAKGGSSKTTILSKASSSGGEINQPCKQDLSSDSDLETDGLISDEEARKKTNSNCSPHQELSLPAGPPSSGPGKYVTIWLRQEKMCLWTCAKSADSDNPAHA